MYRIEKLRVAALSRRHTNEEFFYRFYKKFFSIENCSEEKRYSEAYYQAFENLTPHITDGELIVGETTDGMSEAEREEWNEVIKGKQNEFIKGFYCGQDSHMAPDYDLLLKEGIRGIIKRIDTYFLNSTPEKSEFYCAAKKCLLAIARHSEKYSEYAEALAEKEMNEERKSELLEISRICKKVPMEPAESFHEAVQSVHFLAYCLSLNPNRASNCYQQFQLGHPDRYLLPYYEKDIKSGALTKERAGLLLDLLGIQINMRVPRGLSSGYMVGGRYEDGSPVANELTKMLLDVIDDVKLVYPSVGLCYNDDIPDEVLDIACKLLMKGRSHPAIFGDDLIASGLMSYGVPKNEAYSYIHSTCVEITPVASSNVWVASPYTNMAKLLLDTMDREYESFEALLSAVFERLDAIIKRNFEEQNSFRKRRADGAFNPLLSCFVNDCLSRGLDIEKGGAKYNWIMPSFVGMANLVDALYVLKTLVFDNREFTISSLKAVLNNNFEGNEALRLRILNDIPKYGNDVDEVDKYYGMITDHIVSECAKYNSLHSEGRLIPSVFCWVKHELFGRETGATVDGRAAGFPLGDGSGPCQGREMRGPTASILSATKWDHSRLIGGVAVNMKFSSAGLGQNSLEVMKSLVKTYIRLGGFEIQINVTDKKLLEKARLEPEKYRDLVVRIGGYSDYFTCISPQMQEEIILRTEHTI